MTKPVREYTSALFSLATENNAEKEILNSFSVIEEVLSEFPRYFLLISSPNIPVSERENLISESFSGKCHILAVIFLKLLCRNERFDILPQCIKEYKKLYSKHISLSAPKIISAVPLSDAEKKELIKTLCELTQCEVRPEYKTDKSILGGIIIRIDDRVFDGSLIHRLQNIKEVMKNENKY